MQKKCDECGAPTTKGFITHRPGCSKALVNKPEPVAPVDAESPAVWLGRRGGEARARKLSQERLSEIARKAAQARWGIREEEDKP